MTIYVCVNARRGGVSLGFPQGIPGMMNNGHKEFETEFELTTAVEYDNSFD